MESKILKIGKNRWEEGHLVGTPLREKCPNMELFLVSIFLYSVRIWTLFTQWQIKQPVKQLHE